MLSFAAKLNELPTTAWLGLAILGFLVWWPLGFAIFAYLIWSRNMWCCGFNFGSSQERRDWVARPSDDASRSPTSGNRTFDEYQAETLRRLEEDQRDFQNFLARLRMAKDKAEFDQFMAEHPSRMQTASPPNCAEYTDGPPKGECG
jgi:hypothetical protein